MALIALVQRAPLQTDAAQARPDRARHLRRRAVLRRRHDHAGHLGALGGRGPRGRRRPAVDADFVVPIALVILIGLFVIQRFGTGAVGALFGPVMVVWFAVARRARARANRSTTRGSCARCRRSTRSQFFVDEPRRPPSSPSAPSCWPSPAPRRSTPTWATSGATRSAAPGSCSCSRRWCCNYFGQGALVLRRPGGRRQPVLPARARTGRCIPLVVLATLATVIASQAVISGAFSLTRQAMQLGFLPRLRHPPHLGAGDRPDLRAGRQLGASAWRSSASCSASARRRPGRGLRHRRHRHAGHRHDAGLRRRAHAVAEAALARASAARSRFLDRRPRVLRRQHRRRSSTAAGSRSSIAAIVFTTLMTWRAGASSWRERCATGELPLDEFLARLATDRRSACPAPPSSSRRPAATRRARCCTTSSTTTCCTSTWCSFTARTTGAPRVADDERLTITDLGHGIRRVTPTYGFQEEPNLPVALQPRRRPRPRPQVPRTSSTT